MTSITRSPGEADAPEGAAPGARGGGWPDSWTVAVSVAAGVGLRVIVLFTSLGRPDSDEVIAGLMARHLGEAFPAFFWGQHYGGTIQLLPVAASMSLFGTSVAAMRLPTIALAALNAVLVWRCGRRIMAERNARMAGLLAWVWPPAAVWFGVREQLFYVPTLTLGLTAWLIALQIAADPSLGRRWRSSPRWAALGLVLGLGWWTSPNIIYFVLPTALALTCRRFPARGFAVPPWRGLAVAAASAGVGAIPWLASNVGSGLPALRDSVSFPRTGSYQARVWWFLAHGLPAELGWRSIGDLEWIGGAFGVTAFLVTAAVLVLGVRSAVRGGDAGSAPGPVFGRRSRWVLAPDALGLVTYPLLVALIPFVMAQSNLRYMYFLSPFLCLVLARMAVGRRSSVVLLAVAMTVSGMGLARLHTVSESPGTQFRVGGVGDLSPAISALDAAGVRAVYADYWVAYRLVFETRERILARPSAGTLRSVAYRSAVEASSQVAWVVSSGDQEGALIGALDHLRVGHRQVAAGEFVVVFTTRPVSPDELPNAARAPAGAEVAPPYGRSY